MLYQYLIYEFSPSFLLFQALWYLFRDNCALIKQVKQTDEAYTVSSKAKKNVFIFLSGQ